MGAVIQSSGTDKDVHRQMRQLIGINMLIMRVCLTKLRVSYNNSCRRSLRLAMTNSASVLFVECKPIDVSTTINVIDNLYSKYSFRKGGMSNNYLLGLRLIKHEICESVTLIINQSLTTGIFPNN